ncbi:MAG TPA: glycosyltransferase family 4 protein [Chthonomonadales bacterium]|nr:glycosyltransferase family 4 protein [Chthonomonadales bacterium]
MRLLVLTRYGCRGASSRIRMGQFLPYLRERGIEPVTSPLLSDSYLNELYRHHRRRLRELLAMYSRRIRDTATSRRFDAIWLEKELLPYAPAWVEAVAGLGSLPYVVDYDDAVFHTYDAHRLAPVRALLGGKIDAIMRRAAAVTAGNPYLVSRAQRAGARRVELIPSVVDTSRYRLSRPPSRYPFTVGWIGTPVTASYLRQIAPSLKELSVAGPLRIMAIGAGELDLAGLPVELHDWSEETEAELLNEVDVGVMPLPDEPWERGKCGYKLIQYMASGLPVVASPVGVNVDIVKNGVSGFLASSGREWTESLSALRASPAMRAALGAEGRRIAEQSYSLQAVAPTVAAVLLDAASNRCANKRSSNTVGCVKEG